VLNMPQSDQDGMDDFYLPRNNLWPLSVPYPAKGMGGESATGNAAAALAQAAQALAQLDAGEATPEPSTTNSRRSTRRRSARNEEERMEPDEPVDNSMPLTLGRSVWAIRDDALPRLIEAHRAGGRTLERLALRASAATPKAARRQAAARAGGAVAVIPLTGVITPRGSFLSFLFGGGGGGLVDFRETFRQAVSDPDVGAIVLDVDSPGGLIDLVPETADEIRAARGDKPIIAVANTMAASAAYWIASQADELVVTPSGDVGSVGVYMVHEDWSGWNQNQGIIPTYISAGEYKTEGNPDEPLSDEARAEWQQEVDDLYAMFVGAVAAGRGVSEAAVRDGYGEGRTLLAERALAAGMVDRVDTIENVISGLLASGGQRPGAAAFVLAPSGRSAAPVAGELAPADEAPEADPPAPEAPDQDPTHVPEEAPPVEPPADPVEPDVGPDAPQDAEARALLAELQLAS
jgi:signal peptide peptidase SppA